MDPKVVCMSRLGNTLWFLGHPESAMQARDAALALADEIGHPYSQATALVFAAILSLDMRDDESIRGYAATLRTGPGNRTGLPNQFAAAAIAGYLDVVDGRTAVGIARIQRALDETRGAEHAPGMQASIARVLLEACVLAADTQAGIAAAKRVIAMEASLWEAEARRLLAELLATLNAPQEDVEAELERALQIARRQGARALELRAATSVLRLRRQCRDELATREARAALQAMLDEMPEGRDTRDAREAISLLQ